MSLALLFFMFTALDVAQDTAIPVDSIRVEALAPYIPPRPAKDLTEVFPSRWVDLIRDADTVECFLLRPGWGTSDPSRPAEESEIHFSPWAIRQNGGTLSEDSRARLEAIILDPRSYLVPQGPGTVKGCIVDYNVGYVFLVTTERSDMVERVIVSICHSCSSLQVRIRGSTIVADIDYAKDAMLELSKELFPDDAEIRSLYHKLHGH